MMGIWISLILLVPFFAMMMVLGSRRRRNDEVDEVGSGGEYPGEEEYLEEEEGDNGSEDDGKKTMVDQTPLWKREWAATFSNAPSLGANFYIIYIFIILMHICQQKYVE